MPWLGLEARAKVKGNGWMGNRSLSTHLGKERILMETLDLFKDWTPEMIASLKSTGSGRGGWSGLTPERYKERCEAISRGNKVTWDSYSVEAKNSRVEAQTLKVKEFWASLSEEEKVKELAKRIHSPEAREASNEGLRQRWANLPEDEKEGLLKNSFHSKEAREKATPKRSESLKASWRGLSPEDRAKRVEAAAEGVRGCKDRRSESLEEFWSHRTFEERHQHYLNSFGTEEAAKARGRASKKAWDSYTPEEKQARLERQSESVLKSNREETQPEFWVEVFLDSYFPGKWVHSGSGLNRKVLGRKFPDFINEEDKELIEVFGIYWHSEDEVEPLIEYYKNLGYKCLIIWDYDCYFPTLKEIFRLVAS